mgnify:FL=1
MMKSQIIKKGLRWGIRIGCVAAVFVYAFFFYGHDDQKEAAKPSHELSIEEKSEKIAAAMSPEDKVGQLLMAGILKPTLDADAGKQIQDCHIGNIILFDRNMESQQQVSQLTNKLRSQITTQSHIAPFIALDQEGGQVLRMRQDFPAVPSETQIGKSGQPEEAKKWASITGKTLQQMGINVNFAPVVDLGSKAERSYSMDPDVVTNFAVQACQGYADAGIWCALKHFPGIGKVKTDPHVDGDQVQVSREELEQQDLKPFRDILQQVSQDAVFVMVSNVNFPALDAQYPACVSNKIMTDLLRHTYQYQGLIVSDDMEMGAMAKHYAFSDMGVMAIKAGADMVLVCHDYGHERETYEGLLNAYRNDDAFRQLVDERVQRIIRIKLAKGTEMLL